MRRHIVITSAIVIVLLLAASQRADAINTTPGFVTGLTLASIGGAGSLVSGIGSFAFIAHRQYTGGWGWLSLLSGGMTLTGGLLMATNDRIANSSGGAGAIVGVGILSVVVGIVGLTLYSPEAKRRHARELAQVAPILLTTPRGEQVPALGIHGVF